MMPDLSSSLTLATPEVILAVGAMVLLMIGVFSGERANNTVTGLTVALLAAIGAWMLFFPADGEAFGGAFINDPFARFMKIVTLIGSLVTLVMSVGFAREEKFDRFEYPILIMLATLGMMLMISANDMIALYLGLELQSLSLYVVAAINRDNVRSTEAGLKYFVLGALSSGMLLYGISLVYGYTGATGFEAIAGQLAGGERQLGLVFGLVFVLAGLAWVAQRPDYVPVLLFAALLVVTELLFLRPPGVASGLAVIGLEAMRSRAGLLRERGFFTEWITAGVILALLLVAERIVLAVFFVDQPAFTLAVLGLFVNIAAYPAVAALSVWVLRVRRLAPGEHASEVRLV